MKNDNIEISVIMTALNEEMNISNAINNTLSAFDDYGINGEIVAINDGSADKTPQIIKDIMGRDNRVNIIEHQAPKGVGASFWDGVDKAKGQIVVWLPGDNENDPWEIFRYHKLLEHVDMVVPFIFNRELRPAFRNALSYLYRFIINTTFSVNFNYTNGTILYRKSLLKELKHRNTGFFFQTDILIRTAKKGYLFAEVPYKLGIRGHGVSKAISFPSFIGVVRGYARLVKDYYFNRRKENSEFAEGSQTALRRQG